MCAPPRPGSLLAQEGRWRVRVRRVRAAATAGGGAARGHQHEASTGGGAQGTGNPLSELNGLLYRVEGLLVEGGLRGDKSANV